MERQPTTVTMPGRTEPSLTLCLFGPFEVRVNGAPLPRLRSRKGVWLLALLALRQGRAVERDWLASTLWPESTSAQLSHNLSMSLTDLRHALGSEAGRLRSPRRHTLCLDLTSAAVDVLEFDAAIARGDASSLERAVALYRGPLLEGCAEEWALPERQKREQAYLQALERLAGLDQARGETGEAERYVRLAVAADPLRESAQRALMELLAAGGSYAAALLIYRELRLRLHRELNAQPDPETHALFERLRDEARRKSSARHPAHFSPRPSPSHVTKLTHSLPHPLTRFFGREAEISRLCTLLRDEETRLVTLTGVGGSGKTRLAVQIARPLHAKPEAAVPDRGPLGCWFVPLLDLTDPRLILDRVREIMGLPRAPDREPLEQIVAFLSRRPSLLVLDNFEHLVEGGTEIVQALLEGVKCLTALVTSRHRLDLPGEREFPLTPLPVPVVSGPWPVVSGAGRSGLPTMDHGPLTTLTACPSVQLFVDRVQAARPDFQVTEQNAAAVAELCRRLDGLPLAIELAAARSGVLTPQEMLVRLDQPFDLLVGRQRSADLRHRSLRATLDWSYQLLPPELQRFFARLSIFRGGWTLAAAEAVCDEPRTLEYMEELQRCSLVETEVAGEETRYRLLETLREYGEAQLSAEERTVLAERHLDYYQDRRQNHRPGTSGQSIPQRLDEVEREQGNLRAALDWWVKSGAPLDRILKTREPHRGLIPVYFWQVRGSAQEGSRRLAEILALPRAAAPTFQRAFLLFVASRLARQQKDFTMAQTLLQESLAIYQGLGHEWGELGCWGDLAHLAREQREYAAARSFDEQCLAMAQRAGYELDVAWALVGLGRTAYLEGDLGMAQSHLGKALAILQKGPEFTWTRAHAALAVDDLDDSRARTLHQEAVAHVCEFRAELALARGDYTAARADLEESLTLFPELGQRRQAAFVRDKLGHVALHQGQWRAATAHFSENLGFWRQEGETEWIAACLEGLAATAVGQSEPERAVRLLAAAAALRESRGLRLPPVERADPERVIAEVRAGLGEAAWAAAWAEGQAMPVEAVIAEALQDAPAGYVQPKRV